MTRHTSIVTSVYTLNTDLDASTWPLFVFKATTSIANDHECSTLCILLAGPCELFYTDTGTSTCYMGSFNVSDGTILVPPVNGPFHQLQDAYGKKNVFYAIYPWHSTMLSFAFQMLTWQL